MSGRRAIFGAILFAIFTAAFTHVTKAMNPERLLSQYVRQKWGSDSGLLGDVHTITQTDDGYLWIGTEKGLFRFDGRTFRSVGDQRPGAATIEEVLGLAVDSEGALIVRLPERNLLRYQDGTFENALQALHPRELAITAMARGSGGAILVVGIINGLLRYSGGKFETLAPVTALSPSLITSLAESADGKIWMGTTDAGLLYVDHGHVVRLTKGLPSPKVTALLATGIDVWIGTEAGLVRWNGVELTADGVPPSWRHVVVHSMLKDRDANLWMGTSTGLERVNSSGRQLRIEADSDHSGPVDAIFEDREGDLWAGGTWGLERLSDEGFATYGRPEGLKSDRSGAVFVDPDGRVWFAPMDGGLHSLQEGREERITEAGLASDVVYSIAGGADGIWVGRQRGGLTHLYPQDGALLAKSYTTADGLAPGSIYSVYEGRNGAVWAGTLNAGLSVLERGRFTNFTSGDGLASNSVTAMLESADGTMWFGTPDGLRSLSNGRWRQFGVKDGLPGDEVNCLEEDSRGVIWIGTSAGLAFIRDGQIESATRFSEALRDQVFGVTADRTGSLWVVSAGSVVRVNRDRLLRGAMNDNDEDIVEYGVADGLRSVQAPKRSKCIVLGPLGKIWISTNSGLSVIDPAQSSNPAPTIPHIVSIYADNNAIDTRGAIKIAAPPKRLSFAYSGVSLRDPTRVRFRYQLEGYDDNWSQPTSAHEATYTRLRPGTYRFRVTARNPDGLWNTAESSLGFQISPLYWQTWWFGLCLVAVLVLGTLALFRVRIHMLTSQMNVRFEERLEERTRIAQELHDTLLQGFLSACMRLDVALDSLSDGSTAKNSLVPVLNLMRRVVDEGRNAVSGLRSATDVGPDLPQAFSRMRDELGLPEDVQFRVIIEGHERRLNPMLRDDVYRICREALVNTVRHSRAKSIEVAFHYTRKQFRVLVQDDGRGIDPHVLQSGRAGHWGLPGMRERTERIGGKLHVRSSSSAGTEVELALPGHVAFESKPLGVLEKWRGKWNRRTGSTNRVQS